MVRRGVCLDLDGTIIDSRTKGIDDLHKVTENFNLPFSPDIQRKIISLWGTPGVKIIEAVWPNKNTQAVYAEWTRIDIQGLAPIFPGVLEALEKLAEKFYLSILTSRGRQSAEFQIYNYRDLFSFVLANDENTQYHKPDPKSMDLVWKKYGLLNLVKENVIYVGDSVNADLGVSRACGIEFYGVTTGVNTRDDFIAAGLDKDYILNSIADLPDILIAP